MARAGISYEDVSTVANELLSAGKNPTIDTVREILGTGSKSTLAPLLKRWKNEQQTVGALPSLDMPKQLYDALKNVYDSLKIEVEDKWLQAQKMHEQTLKELADEKAEHLKVYEDLVKVKEQLVEEFQTQLQTNESLQQHKQQLEFTLEKRLLELNALQHRLDDRAQEILELKKQFTKAQEQFEHFQTASLAEREKERQMFTEQVGSLDYELREMRQKFTDQQQKLTEKTVELKQHVQDQQRMQTLIVKLEKNEERKTQELEKLQHKLTETSQSNKEMQKQQHLLSEHLVTTQQALAMQQKETRWLIERLESVDAHYQKLLHDKAG